MLIVKLRGGMGNQMFQFAFAHSLAEKLNTELYYDDSLLRMKPSNDQTLLRDFSLECFELSAKPITGWNRYRYVGVPYHVKGHRWYNFLGNLFFPKKELIETDRRFHAEYLKAQDGTCMVGSFQSEKYFKDSRELVCKDFTFKSKITGAEPELANRISSNHSVGLHVRRGDYVNDPDFKEILGHIGKLYYQRAIQELEKKHQDLTYFIFSDDPEWAEEHIGKGVLQGRPFQVVRPGQHDRQDAVEMYLLSLCKHFVISNSTFSWWSAWLSNHPEKMVIAPAEWVSTPWKENYQAHPADIVPDNWIRMSSYE
ncbi:alpha-1,2-fucosyltransferase [bacterium SCSIO 12741]|nr:alpha-1,2-fucosyltransferase [bacterium SCSIO 12741]